MRLFTSETNSYQKQSYLASSLIVSYHTLYLQPRVLLLENLRHFLLNRRPRRLPPKNLARSLTLTPRVPSPANSLKAGLLNRRVLLKRLLLGILQIPELNGLLADSSGKVAPDVLAAVGENVAFGTPELCVGVSCDCCFDEKDEEIGQVIHVDVVPAGFAGADDGDVLAC
jgi:hypothetical protein